MQTVLPSLAVAIALLVQFGLPCFCPQNGFEKDKQKVMKESYNEIHNIYTGVVLEANCKCLPEEPEGSYKVKCLKLSNNTILETKRYNCRKFQDMYRASYYLRNYKCDSVTEKAFDEESYESMSDMEDIDSCRFRGTGRGSTPSDDCDMSLNPCSYKILVKKVFKGDYKTDEVVYSNGPDANGCGQPGKVLEINESYMIGMGASCTRFTDWSLESSYNATEIELLETLQNELRK